MSYIDGFVIAVPTANQQAFMAHSRRVDPAFIDHGAARVVVCWGADVPKGKITDFQGAVAARDDETVALCWIEWPDKATRDHVMSRMDALAKTDERFDPAKNPAPFDGKRMIYGGFRSIYEQGAAGPDGYIQGFVIPVPAGHRDAYLRLAAEAWALFKDHGALRVVEAWGDDVPEGKVTDFRRAVRAAPGEEIVFAFMEWPSRAACDAAHERMAKDERMNPPGGVKLPFDGTRMIFAGFAPLMVLEK